MVWNKSLIERAVASFQIYSTVSTVSTVCSMCINAGCTHVKGGDATVGPTFEILNGIYNVEAVVQSQS